MKRKPVVPMLLLFGTVAIFGYDGCTVTGFCVGTIIDNYLIEPDYDTIRGWHPESVEQGKDITVTMKTGEKLKGEYLGLDTVPTSRYAELYNEVRERYQKDIPLPAVGDSISLVPVNSETEHKVEFLGFEDQYMWVKVMGISGNERGKIDMNKLKKITDASGNVIEVEKLINLSLGGKIPALTEVTLRTDSDTTRIPTASVSRIAIPHAKSATRWAGLWLGACIDAAIIIVMITMPK